MKKIVGGGTAQEDRRDVQRGTDEALDEWEVQGRVAKSNRLYPYAQTRVRDFADMTSEEVIDWWID